MSKQEFKHESVEDGQSVAKYIKAIMTGLQKGQLVLGAEDDEMTLSPNGLVEFEIKAKSRKGKNKVSLKFSWRDEEHIEPPEFNGTIFVPSKLEMGEERQLR